MNKIKLNNDKINEKVLKIIVFNIYKINKLNLNF
jgi:hypothetical protein